MHKGDLCRARGRSVKRSLARCVTANHMRNRTFQRKFPSPAKAPRLFRPPCLLLVIIAFSACSVFAQAPPHSRIAQPIDEQVRVTLKGNVHPLAQPRYDRGAVADSFPVERMLLLLQRSPERETALGGFLQDVHTQGSPSYHQWLTPERFGELYGTDDSEIAAVSDWLQGHGFSVARVTKGKTAVEFSGTAGQVREAFRTEIHAYFVDGEEHHANNIDPEIPAGLAQVVAGITPMNDFRPQPQVKVLGRALYSRETHAVTPQWTINNSPPVLALAPGDFAVQYDLNPLYSAGVNGSGITIGIIGASNVFPDVVAGYRSLFGLPAGTLNIIIDGRDPGPSATVDRGNIAEVESFLDVELSGAVAPGAIINLYTAADTTVQPGLFLAAQRAVDDDVAAVLSTSYGQCEQAIGSSGNQFWAALWQQAAAQGQTSFVSSGDSGSAGCDNFNVPQEAQHGLAVNGFGSTPWNISVGGTDFFYTSYNGGAAAQNAELATYWSLTPTGITSPTTSLLKPIPEQPWNQAFGLDLYNHGVYNPNAPTIVAGSGGASSCSSGVQASDGSFGSCTKGYAKPAWQSGKGVPADGARDLPDVSLFAANGENASFYPICLPGEGCTGVNFAFNEISAAGGTSASSPAMAGIMALVNQKYGRQGQANFILYPLATQHPSVFHDITIGNNNAPCQQGTPDCSLSTLTDNTKGFYTLGHYYAGPGYDQATGLGSVDANLLVQNWNSLIFVPTSTSLNLSQTTFTHGTPIDVNVAVTGTGGTPSGDIGLLPSESPAAANVSLNRLTLQNGTASATVNNLPGGQYQLSAKYTGDTIFAASSSIPVTLNVAPEASTVSVTGSYWNNTTSSFSPISTGASFPYGTYLALDAQPVGANSPKGGSDGIATGTVSFTDTAGTTTVSSGSLNLNTKGIAEWIPAVSLPVGATTVGASYSGDASFTPSASSTPLAITITKAPTFSSLSARPSPVALGSATSLEVQVSNQFSGPVCASDASCTFFVSSPASPTGIVTFSFGNTTLGTASLVPPLNNLFISYAKLSVASLPLGTDTVTATFSGDANYSSVTTTFNVVVEQPATVTATVNPGSINQAEFAQVNATVTGLSGQPAPTGTVTFSANGSIGGSWTDTQPLKGGSATSGGLPGYLFFPAKNGQITVPVTAAYSGDSTYGPGSAVVSLTVTQGNLPPFSVSATPVTIASPGASAGNSSSVSVTPSNGFTGTVYLSCSLTSSPQGAVHPPTCAIPPSVNISGTATVTAVMAINSTAPGSSGGLFSPAPRGPIPIIPLPTQLGWLAGAVLAIMLLLGVCRPRRRELRLAGFLFLLAVLGSLAACGGGSVNVAPPPVPIPGTTSGSYSFTVSASFTANGASQAQTQATVTIQ
jgi:hypothetical protein